MTDPTPKQATARDFVDADLRDALGLIDDVGKLWPATGLPTSPKLKAELARARAALTEARKTARALHTRGEAR